MEKLTYALKNGSLICINDVKNGLKCGCTCPSCKQALVAKKGKIKVHHFAHKSSTDCQYGYETSLHLLAKDILKESKTFFTPNLFFGKYSPVLIDKKRIIEIKNVLIEEYLSNVKPDVIIEDINGNKYCIEIYVTHTIDDDKLKKITQEKLNTIEIDLSKINRLITHNELKEILLNDNPLKKWIYNAKIEEAKTKFNVPIEKLKNCSLQWENSPNIVYCMTHCGFNIDCSEDRKIIYCKRAIEVMSTYRLPIRKIQLNNCKKCGSEMELDYNLNGAYYKCRNEQNCTYTEKAPEIPIETIQQYNQICPLCGSKLNLKSGYSVIYKKYNKFWGCSNYPNCKYTKSIYR